MRKTLFLTILFLSQLTWGQTKVTSEQQQMIVDKIDKAASEMKTMQCDFTQIKSMKMLSKDMESKGIMYFKRPDKLHWQYTSPYDYIFILNGDKILLKSNKSTKNIDAQKNKVFKQITNVILKSIIGGCLRSSSDFTVELYQIGKSYFVKLIPKKKEVKQFYSSIEIFFNPSLTMVSSVKMLEKTGDVTIVKLNNVKTNLPINEKMFIIN